MARAPRADALIVLPARGGGAGGTNGCEVRRWTKRELYRDEAQLRLDGVRWCLARNGVRVTLEDVRARVARGELDWLALSILDCARTCSEPVPPGTCANDDIPPPMGAVDAALELIDAAICSLRNGA